MFFISFFYIILIYSFQKYQTTLFLENLMATHLIKVDKWLNWQQIKVKGLKWKHRKSKIMRLNWKQNKLNDIICNLDYD